MIFLFFIYILNENHEIYIKKIMNFFNSLGNQYIKKMNKYF